MKTTRFITKKRHPKNGYAFSPALVGESYTDSIMDKWYYQLAAFNGITHGDLNEFAAIIAYKVAYNLKNGFVMDPAKDPLKYK